MKKPHKTILRIDELGPIREVKTFYRQTSEDSAETYIMLIGDNGKSTFKWSSIEKYVTFHVFAGRVLKLNHEYDMELDKWFDFEEENLADILEFERLKKKLGK